MRLTRQGVRDLSDLGKPRPPSYTPSPGEHVRDALYDRTAEMWEEIRAVFPHAQLTNADDYIKGPRTEVNIEACSREDWYRFLIRSGMATISLWFQIDMIRAPIEGDDQTGFRLIERILDEEQPGWREKRR